MVKKIKRTKKTIEYLRPPVVTIMGHVDHGKTTLLDYLRQTNVAAKEAGGITQHIGAYRLKMKEKKASPERWITLIDTPGHEAFAKMRARGAQVTDMVVLVVAANDGVMPQTIESIAHIKAAKVPFIVALNKIDLPEVNIEKVKRQLAKNNVLVEGYGGDVVCVPISAKTGKGIKELLEMILLLWQMNKESFKADPQGKLKAYVIESKLDKRVGSQATILVKNGTLKTGEEIIIEGIEGKIRIMKNEWGENIEEAGPSVPIEVSGLEKVPAVGALVECKNEDLQHKDTKIETETQGYEKDLQHKDTEKTEDTKEKEKLRIILKADNSGSLEALIYSISGKVEIFEKGIGEINESDVLLAKTVGAVILGFNVEVSKEVEKLAETERVFIKTFKIIYELLDEVGEVIKELKKPKQTEKILGKAKIIADFIGSSGRIAGAKMMEGRFTKQDNLRIEREKKVVFDNLKISSLKQVKKDVDKVSMGMECGIILTPEVDFRVGDMVISYRKLE